MRHVSLLSLVVAAAMIAGCEDSLAAVRRSASDSTAMARTLSRWAQEALVDSSVESRQRAMRDLRDAILLDPSDPEPWNTMGRAYEMGLYREEARDCYRNSIRRAPAAPEGHLNLGIAWKREWLRTLDPRALDAAIAELDTVTRLRPRASDPWLRLVPLIYEHGDLLRAAEAAERALAGRPRRVEAGLAVAYLAYRRGDLERADSAFAAVIPRLDPSVRALLDDTAWIGLGSHGRRAWDGLDPDPTTRQNELQLEYWSRVAHAFLVFYDPMKPELDARAETYVRYGAPRTVELNPLGTSSVFRYASTKLGPSVLHWDFPLDAQVWSYPELGVRVVLHDHMLSGHYDPALTRDFDPLSVPDPGLLAHRGDLVSLGEGHAVFPTLPPRNQRLDVRGRVARFEGERRPRLFAQVQVDGDAGDTLWARAVVLDSTGHEIARGAPAPGASVCDPTARRVVEFSSDLPPGAFEVAISVHDAHRRRGVYRTLSTLEPPTRALALSDIVLSCGNPDMTSSGETVRLEANLDGRVAGDRAVAYFEIYRLTPGADGLSRFEYEYAVQTIPDAPTGIKKMFVKPEPRLLDSTTREESFVGTMRRQFVTVPIQSLPAGHYRLEIRVRDRVAGDEASGATDFVRE